MSKPSVDSRTVRQRRLLLLATGTVGGVGLAGATLPFVASMAPSRAARSKGAPVEVNLDSVEPGALVTVAWRGKPVWILHRTRDMLDRLGTHDNLLGDPRSKEDQQPAYARNATRSLRPDYFVAVGICTHLGCIPNYRPEVGAPDLGDHWPGGFFCPCHGSKFDLAGRVFLNVPAPLNLEIPPYQYLDNTRLIVGEDRFGAR
ncbi:MULTISPECIES: ubiquinol-cytochrome c reductase iron-sulfur subunit [Ralstonia]|uniref:Ubiquinol-cytochrome c reductase iron-sulfur subunit n=2 Tax=Ralstonia TaxID=48736 RepID=A0AAD2F5Q0_9RALS|nr:MULTISPECIES: ubiquinol-cytochrome c reductase iron-sulfur subunit [Ralstonia]NOZ15230.1 ubiquinol-cytochrome c reductase iron-sulfur subunit [Betaproteobacteria bacterium]MCK8653287.1 ubiquinol-cytochrome c reductase iron-sulfur subunit [Ralstonia insidiosa]NOZ99594.1 ubiquinol-cytochrome c reductase iron-sulfur subunit [Betaproteobacteria bacterium]NYS10901.1 ubiquinol-cytochrome c reductase iron-sulfur subunit [Ralstonia pickettii]CAJ0804035.1 Ubiquinol-cytochrome c reductase iron-sulfur